jgi:hypothetical protein
MKTTKKLSKSLRKHMRKEKARIRREFFDIKTQQERIERLYNPDKPIEKPKKEKPKLEKIKSKKEKPEKNKKAKK